MKTTLDLPDDLLIAAKKVAAERRTTLKEMVTRSLRREIGMDQPDPSAPDSRFEVGPLGIFRLKKRGEAMTTKKVRKLMAEADEDEMRRALAIRNGEKR
ncbi:MAG TPA: hypothetical protein VGA56_03570 [Opitutaceae bacterium]